MARQFLTWRVRCSMSGWSHARVHNQASSATGGARSGISGIPPAVTCFRSCVLVVRICIQTSLGNNLLSACALSTGRGCPEDVACHGPQAARHLFRMPVFGAGRLSSAWPAGARSGMSGSPPALSLGNDVLDAVALSVRCIPSNVSAKMRPHATTLRPNFNFRKG